MRWNILFIMCFSIFLFESCTKDDPHEIQEETGNFIQKDIGSEGGFIEIDNLLIEIQSGTFENQNNITLSKINTINQELEGSFSSTYQIKGLPPIITKPILITLNTTKNTDEPIFFVIEENGWAKTMRGNVNAHRLFPVESDNGVINAEIPIYNGLVNGLESLNAQIREEDKISFNIFAVSGYVSAKSTQGNFAVITPSSYLDQVLDFTEHLENAYSTFKNMGFDLSKRTKWPVEVNVKSLKSGVSGYSVNSIWGNNYGYIEINKTVLNNSTDAKVTAGHEFFHLVQSLYDPRNSFSKSKLESPHLWLDEAMSTWSEVLFSGNSNYVSPVFIENSTEPLEGAKNSESGQAGDYGYGMASFIKYIAEQKGTAILPNIYDQILEGKTAFRAISSQLSGTIGTEYEKFIREFLSFKVFQSEDFKPVWLASAAGSSGSFVVDGPEDTLKNFKIKLPDFSSQVFYIKNNNYKDFSENAIVKFKVHNPDGYKLILFKFNSIESVVIAEGRDSVMTDQMKEIVDNNYKLAGVLIQDELTLPYDTEVEINMDIIIDSKFEFDYIAVDVLGDGFVKIDKIHDFWGDTTYIFEGYGNFRTSYDIDKFDQNHEINGNTIITTVSFTDSYEVTRNYVMKSTFNDITNPTKLQRFEYEENYYFGVEGATVTTGARKLVLVDIPFIEFDIYNNSYNFTVWEGCSANVESYYFYEKSEELQNKNSTTRIMESCDFSSGWIQIKYRKHYE